jgi:hypothetical protein
MKKRVKKTTNKKTDKKKHYVDNELFLQAMNDWVAEVKVTKKNKQKPPPVTDYIAECFYKIAEHLSHSPNFINYPYREDMIGDGIENCLRYAHNFDANKSKNPFAYFTQIIFYAFLRKIEKEKNQAFVKYKCIQSSDMDKKYTDWLTAEKTSATFGEFLQNNFYISESDIEKMESKLLKKSKKRKKNKL